MHPASSRPTEHPVELTGDDVMSFKDIRYWLEELMEDPRFGIEGVPGGRAALARVLGVPQGYLNTMVSGDRWIYPSQQRRMSRVIMQIRRGELGLKEASGPVSLKKGQKRAEFVIFSPPKPIAVQQKDVRWRLGPGGKGLVRVPDPVHKPLVPSLRGLFERAKVPR